MPRRLRPALLSAALLQLLLCHDAYPDTPTRLSVPVTLHPNGAYSVQVNMSTPSSAAPPQSLVFALSTSSALSAVAGPACRTCGAGAPYLSGSAGAQAASNVSSLHGNASGWLTHEDCSLALDGGSAWSYPNHTVLVADSASNAFFFSNLSGTLGLGPFPSAYSPAANWLADNPSRGRFTFGMALNGPGSDAGGGGVLHWLHTDPSAYQGEIATRKMLPGATASSWVVPFDAWSVAGLGNSSFNVSQTRAGLFATIEPAYTGFVFPQSATRAIYADIPNSDPGGLTPTAPAPAASLASVFQIPCDTDIALAITIGNVTTTLSGSSLVVRQTDGSCVGAIQEWTDPSQTTYLLGAPFAASVYVIFNYPASGDSTVGVAARRIPARGLSGGAVAGIVLGSLILLALAVIAAVLIRLVRAQNRQKHQEHHHHHRLRTRHLKDQPSLTDVTPFLLASPYADAQDARGSYHSSRSSLGGGHTAVPPHSAASSSTTFSFAPLSPGLLPVSFDLRISGQSQGQGQAVPPPPPPPASSQLAPPPYAAPSPSTSTLSPPLIAGDRKSRLPH